jgi:hypothetical protein
MKNLFLFIALCIFSFGSAFSQVCDNYFPAEVGTTWEITNYDAKNKIESIQKSSILSATESDGGLLVTIEVVSYDTKDNEVHRQTFTTYCKDGNFYIDMSTFLSPESMGGEGSGAQMQMEAQNMELPSGITVGQKLPDAWIKVTMQADGMPTMFSQTINIVNRVVESFESMTTPAGTYDCVKITWDTQMKMVFNVQTHSKVWYAKNVGTVRSEYYDKKGKLEGYSVLTKFN